MGTDNTHSRITDPASNIPPSFHVLLIIKVRE